MTDPTDEEAARAAVADAFGAEEISHALRRRLVSLAAECHHAGRLWGRGRVAGGCVNDPTDEDREAVRPIFEKYGYPSTVVALIVAAECHAAGRKAGEANDWRTRCEHAEACLKRGAGYANAERRRADEAETRCEQAEALLREIAETNEGKEYMRRLARDHLKETSE